MKKRSVYLDNASTTPLDKGVFSAMLPYFQKNYANPSNLYEIGRIARESIDLAKSEISHILHSRPEEIFFTSSATESDNLAVLGVARANKKYGNKIIISEIEHKSVLEACQALKKEGFKIVRLPVDQNGLVSLADLKKNLDKKTVLVSITMADSETGTLQPISEISKIVRRFRQKNSYPYLHTDASQAGGYENLDVLKLGVDLMTISSHKIGGPKGVAGLYIKSAVRIEPVIYGGGQQNGLRSSTENVPGIVGFGQALKISEKRKKTEYGRLKKLRDMLEKGISESISGIVFSGHRVKRLPNFSNVSFSGLDAEVLLFYLDNLGIIVSTGSACNSDNTDQSYILKSIGLKKDYIGGTIRFSLGTNTKTEDIKYVLKHLPVVVEKLRQAQKTAFN